MKKLKLKKTEDPEILEKLEISDGFMTFGSGSGSGSELGLGLPNGSLTSSAQEQVGTAFFAPIHVSKVRFTCIANAALAPAFTYRTKALVDWISRTQVGVTGVPTTIDVPVDASNYNVSITFQATDLNGGTYTWQAMY